MPNLIEKDFNKININQSFKAFKRDDLKLVYKAKVGNQKSMKWNENENNQDGYSTTKPLTTVCVK